MGEAQARTAAVTGQPAESSADEAIAAFLKSLPAAGFVPSGESVAALNALSGRSVPADPEMDPAATFAGEVEEFTRQFWSLDPAARQSAWKALVVRVGSGGGPVAARLKALERGLDVNVPPLADPAEAEVVALACELFLLAPAARAVRRSEWLLGNAARHSELCHGASLVRRRSPSTVQLDPVLMSRLTPDFAAAEFVAAASAKPLPESSTGEPAEPLHVSLADRLAAARSQQAADVPEVRQKSGTTVPAWLIVVGVIFLLRAAGSLITSNSSSNEPNQKFPTRQYQPQRPGTPLKLPKFRTIFSAEEVERFKRFNPGSGQVAPTGYQDWLMAGRPEAPPPPWW
jgi:hypothetical protein